MLENGSATAAFTTRVRSYDNLIASDNVIFSDITYSMTEPVTDAQHVQHDCKRVVHKNCYWMFGETGAGGGVLTPCVRLGNNAADSPNTLIGGESLAPAFYGCTFQGDVVLRRVNNSLFELSEFYPRRSIPGTGTIADGSGRFLFDGDMTVQGITLLNFTSADNDGIETFFDATGADLTNLVCIGGLIRSVDKGFVLDGSGPWYIATVFASVGTQDIEILSTATGRLIDNSDESVGNVDNRANLVPAVSGRRAYTNLFHAAGMRWRVTTMADDTAVNFQPTSGSFTGLTAHFTSNGLLRNGAVWLRATGSASQAEVVSGAAGHILAASTVALAGTTGVDGKVTISAVSTAASVGKIYVENRSGGSIAFTMFVDY
jgi:hypothetical protein